ncbi:MAG: long-chain fatty acid--CoA ligase [Comamonadaceae bacterium]|nr:MAG: long-chain fatty acid--CoA ligase [Comamonadaceae bacterium]
MYSRIDDPRHWTLPAALRELAGTRPEGEWLTDSEGATLTFGKAWSESTRAAGFLERLGVARGDRAGVFMFNSCAFVTAWMGLGHLGATAVLLNTELRGAFLRHQLNDSEVDCVIADAELLEALTALAGDLPHLKTVVVVGAMPKGRAPFRLVAWPQWAQQPDWSGPGPSAEEIACIMYTSGTSGPSKGVLMPHAHCTLYGIGAIQCVDLQAEDRYYISLPLFHANGLLMQLGATLLAGVPAFIKRRFSASSWLADIRNTRATVTNLLGATAGFILAQPSSGDDTSNALRAVLTAPNLPQHEALFRSRFGVADVVSGFGMTEVNIPIWGRIGRSVPGAAGWAHEEHFEVRIANPDTDLPVAHGQVGEILVRPKIAFGFMAGYFNAPGKTVEAWRNLWFHTGDAGTMQADGLITFIDRIKDCIRRRGENISASEVEAVVATMPGVAEVAAYAVPSDIQGAEDEVMLALVAGPGVTLDAPDIVRRAGEQLPRFARPRFVRVIEALPKTATGKVQRAVLRKQGIEGALDMERPQK